MSETSLAYGNVWPPTQAALREGHLDDDPALPIDVRAARAWHRAMARRGRARDDFARTLRMYVRWEVEANTGFDPSDDLTEARAKLDALIAYADAPLSPGDREVRPLGHYEQMQIDIALAWIVNPDEPPQEPDIATLRDLQSLFTSHGTVTVTRYNA